ncbi:MAG: L-2-amino-thiazoline-4-carboxylic acid hydrolase [Pseudomonadota bacterium]
MKHNQSFDANRRFFVTKIMPACALACSGCGGAVALAPAPEAKKQVSLPARHKFDMPYDKELTFRGYYLTQYREAVQFIKAMLNDVEKDMLFELIKTYSEERSRVFGKSHAERVPANDFKTYIDTFRDPKYQNTLTMEIIEDTQTVFEIKVSECIWASTFIELDAADIGYLYVCHGDYTWASGFNPGINLTRDKTLMQGHDCCNHRYSWQG